MTPDPDRVPVLGTPPDGEARIDPDALRRHVRRRNLQRQALAWFGSLVLVIVAGAGFGAGWAWADARWFGPNECTITLLPPPPEVGP